MSVAMHTSPVSRPSLDEPLGFDAGELSDHGLVEMMTAARRLASRVQAVELAAVAELARRRFAEAAHGGDDGRAPVEVLSPRDYVHDEVAEALTLTSASAGALIRFATELTGRLPATFTALAAGDIDYAKARTLWHATDQVDDELAHTIEAAVLHKAAGQTTGQIRAKVRRLVKRLAPEALARRREEAERRRGVELIETEDGTAQLSGVDLPAEAAGAAYGRVTAIATGLKRDGDDRGIDQLRADVFLALLRGTLTPSEPPADTTDRPIGTSAAGDPGWTTVDDAIADVIATAARTELTRLTDALNDPHRDAGVLATQAEPSGVGGSSVASADTVGGDCRGVGGSVAQTGLCVGGSSVASTGVLDGSRRALDALAARAGARINRSLAALIDDPPERHRDIGGLIAQAGARINRSLADLRSRWCVPGPATGSALGPAVGAATGPVPGPAVGAATGAPFGGGGSRLAHGLAGYRPPATLRRLIEYRDRRCCFPGCRRPARHCDADHSIPFHHGGATCACNLELLCRRHHRGKQTTGWHIEHLWPGVILWITPTGHWKITAPADRE